MSKTSNLSDLAQFFENVKRTKTLALNSINAMSNAVAAVDAELQSEEKTVEFVLENREVIKRRLQNSNKNITGETIEVYLKRTFTALNHFLGWSADRAAWEKKVAARGIVKPIRKGRDQRSEDFSSKPQEKEPIGSRNNIEVPTGEGSFFKIQMPENFFMGDVVRVAWTLAAYAQDFDPEIVLRTFGKPPTKEAKLTSTETSIALR